MFRWLLALVVIAAVAAGAVYVLAGRGAAPSIAIDKPDRWPVGQGHARGHGRCARRALRRTSIVSLEQDGRATPLFTLDAPESATIAASRRRPDARDSSVRQARPSRSCSPAPPASWCRASRPSFLNLRTLAEHRQRRTFRSASSRRASRSCRRTTTSTTADRRWSSTARRRRTSPRACASATSSTGFPASGAGVAGADPSLQGRVLRAAARSGSDDADRACSRATKRATRRRRRFVDEVFAKPFRKSRIELDDKFLQRVVPEILAHSPELKMHGALEASPAAGVPQDQRRTAPAERGAHRGQLAEYRRRPGCGRGPSSSSGNSQVEASFADHRTYLYKGKEVDQQVHLGFDLAVTARVPVAAANAGKVLHASWLGIYGNCVIIDHGMGVASLYGHLSSFDVKAGDTVDQRSDARPQRDDRPRRRRPPAFHDARRAAGRSIRSNGGIRTGFEDRVERKLSEAAAGAARGSSLRYHCRSASRRFCAHFLLGEVNASTKRLGQCTLGLALAASVVACGGGQRNRARRQSPHRRPAHAVGPESRYRDGRRREGTVDARRRGAEERADQDERRSGLPEGGQGPAVAGDLRRRQRRQVARQRVRLRQGRPRQLRLRHADRDR